MLFRPLEPLISRLIDSRLVVLVAHYYPELGFNRDLAKANLEYLKRTCHVLPLAQAMQLVTEGRELPARAVALLVDDGTRSFYEIGWPLLRAEGIPFTLAVVAGLVDPVSPEYMLARLMQIAGRRMPTPNDVMLAKAWAWLQSEPGLGLDARLPSFARVFEIGRTLCAQRLRALVGQLGAPCRDYATWDNLKSLQDSGLVTFASHGMSHPKLSLAEGTWLRWELERSKALIQEKLDVPVDTFVIPFGWAGHLTPGVRTCLRETGYSYCFLTTPGIIRRRTDPLALPRMEAEVTTRLLSVHTRPGLCSLLFPGS